METKSMIGLIIGFLVGAIILASFVPIFVNVQNASGEEITLTNDSPIVLREAEPNDVFTLTRTITDGVARDTLRLNGEEVIGPSGSGDAWNVGLMSDAIYIQIFGSGNSSMGQWYNMNDITPNVTHYLSGGVNGASYGVTFTDGNITIYGAYDTDSPTTIVSLPFTWAYVVCPYSDGEYCSALSGGVGLVEDPTQIVSCGVYTTGELDTTYYYKGGQTYVGNTAYTMVADITTAVHTGTSDIYDATVSITISDGVDSESFTPYRILVPYEVTGHATKGVMFDIFGLLPLIAGVGLLMGAVVYFLRRY